MGFMSRAEGKMEDTFERAVNRLPGGALSPVQIAKKAEKQMRRNAMVGAGKQYAPTLYTVLVNPDDDDRMFGYYPTLAGETETYLQAKAAEAGLAMDGQPLVRFVVDDGLKHGKFDIIAETVAAPIVKQLRAEEMERYGLPQNADGSYGAQRGFARANYGRSDYDSYNDYGDYGNRGGRQPLPYVPEDEIDRSIDYGEYTFNSAEFDDYDEEDVQPGFGDDAFPSAAVAGAAGAAAGVAAAEAANIPRTAVFADGAGNVSSVANDQQAGRAYLVDETDGRTYTLASMRLLVGRETTNDIVVSDINVSRTHAELRVDHGSAWVVTDLGSTNGTYVNGRQITSQALRDGDRITFGMTNFVFRAH